MNQIKASGKSILELGRQGENLARQVVFDLSAWEAEYGPGTVELIHQRPGDTSPYPVAAVREGRTLVWTLTATDTAVASSFGVNGHCELRWYVGETLVKSKTWRTWVESALSTPSETAPPEPEQGWVDQVLAVGAAAKASADAAKADADRAAALAAEVSKKAAQTAQDASDVAKAMEAAQTAQRLAEEAQGAAETARTAAEVAQAAAEQSATDAAGAKQDAETALKSAQDAAAAAAKALADIRALYQEMQTWAQGVIQDVNAAGSAAVQSVQSAGDTQVQRVIDEGATQTANAKAQADAAAQSASEAAQSAQQAAESAAVYDNVVADVTQLKQDITAITPDDTTVDGKPWTSKKIVDTICQPFEETGNPVQVYPVENYPLGVKASWEPVQKGSGDPSPDNIRQISGRDKVSVTRCGRNYIDVKSLDKRPISGCKYESTEKGFRITAYSSGFFKPCLFYLPTDIVLGKTITVSAELTAKTNDVTPGIRIIAYKDEYNQHVTYVDRDFGSVGIRYSVTAKMPDTLPEGCEGFSLNFYCTKDTNANIDDYSEYANVQIELGTTATPYEPYTGSTTDIALPETVYGGTLDVETGVVTVKKVMIALTGSETWRFRDLSVCPNTFEYGYRKRIVTGICTHYKSLNLVELNREDDGIYLAYTATIIVTDHRFDTVEAFKAYLSEQYAAGTPVQIVYEILDPYTIQLTPQQIAALSGVNTLYTDADGVIVTGAEDPKHTITELKNAIISLGGNI